MEAFVLAQNAKFKRKLYGILYNVENPEEMTGYLGKLKKHMKRNPAEVEEALKQIKLTKHHITRHRKKVKTEPLAPPISVSVPAKAKKFNMAEAKELINSKERERLAKLKKQQDDADAFHKKMYEQRLAKEKAEKAKAKPKEEPKPKAQSAQKVFDNPDLLKLIKGYRTRTLYDDMNEEEVKLTKALEMYYEETAENVERFYRMRNGDMVEIKGAYTALQKEIAKELKLPKNWMEKANKVEEKYGLGYGTVKGKKFAEFYRTKYD
jgi:hypothetical protein